MIEQVGVLAVFIRFSLRTRTQSENKGLRLRIRIWFENKDLCYRSFVVIVELRSGLSNMVEGRRRGLKGNLYPAWVGASQSK